MAEYKLSCALSGHSLDVRAICVTPDGTIISGSRDATAKVWRPNGINPGYHEAQTLRGHTNFVNCICFCPPSESYPNGIIVTSGNDKKICGFVSEQESPLFNLQGHSDTVCCLSVGIEPGTFLSASWDKTGKVWNYLSGKATSTFRGHESAVWGIIEVSPGVVITGAADKLIKIWAKASGTCESTLTGHTDCVRGLARVNDHEFLSCANDATVRHWSTTGDCLSVLYGHSNYIYSLAVAPSSFGFRFASVGEDSSLRIWKDSNVSQVLSLPAQSVWSVSFLPNSDVVTGSSDGVVRIFSQDPERQASEDVLKSYEAEIEAMFKVSSQELGGVKISDLPGKEALYEPGRTDGQTKLVREGTKVTVYSWSAVQKEWTKVGDVAGANEEHSGKTLHQGKEYDYVFSIDIKDGVPALKLPYNVTEDPWFAAQKFIHENDLPQAYLEQIANFIVTNSKKSDQPVVSNPPAQPEYCDPFTGGNRYIPAGSQGSSGSVNSSGNLDPFTGGNSYVPNGSSAKKVSNDGALSKHHFPQKSYLRFDQANLKAMLEKLLELNKKLTDGSHQVHDDVLGDIVKLADPQNSPDPSIISTLHKMLDWPGDVVFPVLDVTRLAVRHPDTNRELCSSKISEQFMSKLLSYLQQAPGPNLMLSLRTLCNMLMHPPGESLVSQNTSLLLQQLNQYSPPFSKPLEVAVATFLLNLAVLHTKKPELHPSIDSVGDTCLHVFPGLSDNEAIYRCLVACGTLLCQKSQSLPKWAEELWPHFISMSENTDQRIQVCAQQILAIGS